MQLLLVLFSLVNALSDEAVVTLSTGQIMRGQLIEFRDSSLVFRVTASANDQEFEFEQIEGIEFDNQLNSASTDEQQYCRVQLIDESLFRATAVTIENGVASLKLSNDLDLQIENRNLANILFDSGTGDERTNRWNELDSTALETGDALVIQRKEKLTLLEGVIGNVSETHVNFQLDGRSADVGRDKIEGMIFYHASGRSLAKPVCQITLSDQSSLMARALEFENGILRCVLVSGTPIDLPIEAVSRLNFSLGRAVWLGDLTPTNRDWNPLIANSAILEKLRALKLPRANRSFDNRQLEILVGSQEQPTQSELRRYESGYAMVGGSKLAFALDGQYERLTGIVGFAPLSSNEGDVNLIIRGDKGILFSRHLQKRTLSVPIEIDLNINGVDRLVFEVDYNDGRAIGDILHLCDLKASR